MVLDRIKIITALTPESWEKRTDSFFEKLPETFTAINVLYNCISQTNSNDNLFSIAIHLKIPISV